MTQPKNNSKKNCLGEEQNFACIEQLRKSLNYNHETGEFHWIVDQGRKRAGSIAGTQVNGYRQIRFSNITYMAHRLAWAMHYGVWPVGQIDHENHERSDNRISNLRIVDHVENHKNRPKMRTNTSGYVGVSLNKNGLYESYLSAGGKKIHLGWFKSIDDAIEARKNANIKYGFHQNHGFGTGRSKPEPKPNFKRGKPFALVSPCGKLVIGENLAAFCKKNGLSQGNIWNVISGSVAMSKGWRAPRQSLSALLPNYAKRDPRQIDLTKEEA